MTEKAAHTVNMHTAPAVAADVPVPRAHLLGDLTQAMKDAGPGRFGKGLLGMNG